MNEFKVYSSNKDNVIDVLRSTFAKRELIIGLAMRDIRVKYKKTRLGFIWSFLNPVLMATIFTFFFSEIIHFSAIKNSVVFVLSAYLGWYIFANTLQQCTQVLRESEYILEKVNIHRLFLILARTLAISLEQIVFSTIVLFFTSIVSDLNWYVLFLIPLSYLFSTIAGLAVTFFVTGLSVKRQDIFLLVPHFIQVGIWLTPIFYSIEMLPTSIQFFVNANPFSGLVDFWRFSLYHQSIDTQLVSLHLVLILLFFVFGLRFFIKRESFYHEQL